MMSYKSDFVLAIINNGSPVREINNTVRLPFQSEYKIRLKNKNAVRAKARVWVDGRLVSGLGDFILSPGETLDLERFLDESMSHGNRFKFVPLSDSRVNDPTDSANGEIKVEFYKEQVWTLRWNNDWDKIKIGPLPDAIPTYDDNSSAGKKRLGQTWTDCNTNLTYTSNHCYFSNPLGGSLIGGTIATSQPSNGATVEGSKSNQKFTYGDHFETEAFPTTLILQIRGLKGMERTSCFPKVDSQPKPERERFCGSCGRKRIRRSDKFCGKCGTPFNK